MKATLLLLVPAIVFVSCSTNQSQVGDPVAPPISAGDPYGIPEADAPYQPVDPINPPAVVVPAGVPTAPADPTPSSPDLNGNVYTIMPGDSLWAIARKFDTTVESIKTANGLANDTIISGRTLIIPGR